MRGGERSGGVDDLIGVTKADDGDPSRATMRHQQDRLGDELDGHALFRAADSALLTAKRAGRDRVVAV